MKKIAFIGGLIGSINLIVLDVTLIMLQVLSRDMSQLIIFIIFLVVSIFLLIGIFEIRESEKIGTGIKIIVLSFIVGLYPVGSLIDTISTGETYNLAMSLIGSIGTIMVISSGVVAIRLRNRKCEYICNKELNITKSNEFESQIKWSKILSYIGSAICIIYFVVMILSLKYDIDMSREMNSFYDWREALDYFLFAFISVFMVLPLITTLVVRSSKLYSGIILVASGTILMIGTIQVALFVDVYAILHAINSIIIIVSGIKNIKIYNMAYGKG